MSAEPVRLDVSGSGTAVASFVGVPIAPAVPSPRVGRDGRLELTFEQRRDRTVLTHCRSTLPLQVLAPLALDDPATVVSILNPTGGLVGGDRLTIDVTAGDGTHACLTTPSATKVYRTAGAVAEQHVTIRGGRDAIVEWVPDHTIPFAGAAFRQSIDVDLDASATLVLADAYAAGRVARGELWEFRRLESRLTIRDREGLVLQDRFVLDGDRRWAGLGFADGHPYFGSIVVIANVAADDLTAAIHGRPACGASIAPGRLPRRGVLVRVLAPSAPLLEDAIAEVWRVTRAAVGLPSLSLRRT